MKEVDSIYDHYDFFKQEIPKFHLEGHKKIGTIIGCSLNVLFTILVFGCSCIRGRYLLTGDRPNISSFTGYDESRNAILTDLNTHQFKVAFTVQRIDDFDNQIPANEPNFVEWYAEFYDTEQIVDAYTLINVHECSNKDFEEFHDILDQQKKKFETLRKQNIFYCLDKTDQHGNPINMTTYGNSHSEVYRSLSILYRPCMPKQRT